MRKAHCFIFKSKFENVTLLGLAKGNVKLGEKAFKSPILDGKNHYGAEFVPFLPLLVITLALSKEDLL